MKYKDVFLIVLLLSFGQSCFSKELYEFYNGIRALGMGGASVAVVNDETALILNPAALGKLRSRYVTVIDPEIHTSSTTAQIIKDKNYDVSVVTRPQSLLDNLKVNPDKYYSSTAYLFPSFVVPNFGIGLLASYNYDAEVVSATNTFNLRYRNDYAFLIGYNFKFFDGIIKLGVNAKYINRVEVDTSMPTTSSGLSWGGLVNEGGGFGSDVGLIITGPYTFLPTLAAVWRDVGDTAYTYSGTFYNGRPKPVKTDQTVDVGVSISPILGNHVRMQLTGELEDVLTYSDEQDKAKRLHAGLEFNFYDKLFIRGGWNQRYWTAGLELSGLNMQFQLATYGEEIGTSSQHREDRRYAAKFAFRF